MKTSGLSEGEAKHLRRKIGVAPVLVSFISPVERYFPKMSTVLSRRGASKGGEGFQRIRFFV